uniref:Uncharacterized protein n=1 Tax=Lepeophtheirus salmonis TaxID=72036 RepID=A0A0K2UWX8_LEPSM
MEIPTNRTLYFARTYARITPISIFNSTPSSTKMTLYNSRVSFHCYCLSFMSTRTSYHFILGYIFMRVFFRTLHFQ